MSKTKPACKCGGETTVVDSRISSDWRRRRYRCLACGELFTSIEIKVDAPGRGKHIQMGLIAEKLGLAESQRIVKITEALLGVIAEHGQLP